MSYTWSHALDTSMGSANDSNAVFYNYTYPNNLYNGDYRQDKGNAGSSTASIASR